MSFTYEQLQSLSAVELKEILHKKHIDSVGIFDTAILINLILGNHETQQIQPLLPQSYLRLFDEEKKRNEDVLAKIKDYLDHIDKEQKKVAKKPKRIKQNEVVLATIIENVPARYTKPELERFFSRAGLVDSITLGEIDSVFVPPNMQTRSITIQYQTQKGSKRCKELFHDFEVAKGIRLSVVKDAPTKLKSNKILSELSDLSSNQLTVVQLKNMFIDENKEDRAYMFELREDVEDQCRQYGVMTGIAINEVTNIVMIRFSSEEEALACFNALNGRLFDGRRIEAEIVRNESKVDTSEENANDEDALLNDFLASIAEEEAKFK